MPAQEQTGTTTTDGTEQSLFTADASAKSFLLTINKTNMANGDGIRIRVKKKVLTGDAGTDIELEAEFWHVQDEKIASSIPIVSLYAIEVTLQRIAGTDRSYKWELISL